MNTERLFKIVLVDLTSDQLKLEDELEKTINSDMEINIKVSNIKSLLNRMSINESSLTRFNSMIEANNNNNPSN